MCLSLFVCIYIFKGIGHRDGWSSIVIPGAGEPNLDTFENNPYQNSKQRAQQEVKQLLEKVMCDVRCCMEYSLSFLLMHNNNNNSL